MTKNKYTNLLLQTLGCFISAAGIYSFAVAAEVPVTGIAGICAILYRLFGIPMGLTRRAGSFSFIPIPRGWVSIRGFSAAQQGQTSNI